MGGNTMIRVRCFYMYESEKAVKVEFKDSEQEEVLGSYWLPKSRCKQVVKNCGGFVICGERGEELLVEIPRWLAETDEVAELIREQLLESDCTGDRDEPIQDDEWDYNE